jgi:hypothetical protein
MDMDDHQRCQLLTAMGLLGVLGVIALHLISLSPCTHVCLVCLCFFFENYKEVRSPGRFFSVLHRLL